MATPTDPQTISGVSKIMREKLLDIVRQQINNSVLFLQKFRRVSDRITKMGKNLQALMSIRIAENESVGNRAFKGALPPHSHAQFDQVTVTLGRVYGQLAMDRLLLKSNLKGNVSLVADFLDEEMDSLVTSFSVDMSRQVQGDGSGAMCQITTADGTADTFAVDDSRYLRVGMVIDSWSAKTGGTQSIDSKTIEDVDYINHQVTLTASTDFDKDDYIFREDNRGLEANGLQAAVDDGTVVSTYQGQDRSASSIFKGNLINVGGKPLSEKWLIKACDQVADISGKEPDILGSDRESRRWWAALRAVERRQVNTEELKGGFNGLSFSAGGRKMYWFADKHFPKGYTYILNSKNFAFFEFGEPEWVDNDGAILHRVREVADVMELVLAHYYQLACDRPNAQGRVYNYVEPT